MSSLFPELENDIFISYRQNDNKYDAWVTEFVTNLNKELEATVKDKITVYFDENPRDGLLETHDIDKSLANKLKSLIFIPILSQTYCDEKCFAWQHEFMEFNRLCKLDRFGRDVRLRNGNVASRILPVRIHDLDPDDLKLLQNELGGPIRAIDFYFREPGVNRPLKPEDNEDKNLNKIKYRNQVNKLANSVKEIIYGLLNPASQVVHDQDVSDRGPVHSQKSIAVLPFVNMSNDPEQEYFSDGISEEIINTLVQLPDLKVAGRTSAFSFKNKNEDLRSIAEKLNVSTILEGSVRKFGNRIRITAQLIEASTGYHLWSQKYDRELNDVFIIQDEISRSIVDNLEITFSGKPAILKERPQTQNVEAYQLYLKGMSLFYKRGVHILDGLKCFEDALKIDPDYALALVGLADSYTMLCLHSYLPPEETWPKAAKSVARALQVEPDLAEAHNALAIIANLFEFNWQKAESSYLKALELKPSYIQARCWYALFYLQYVKHDNEEALRQARLAVEYDHLSSYAQTILCVIASISGLQAEAIEAGRKGIEFAPDSFSAWHIMASCHHGAGYYEEAISEYKHAINISGRHNWAVLFLLGLYMEPTNFRQENESRYLYTELLTRFRMSYVSPCIMSIASASMQLKESALSYLKQALDRHDPFIIQTAAYFIPTMKAFHATPGISEMLKSIGLQPYH